MPSIFHPKTIAGAIMQKSKAGGGVRTQLEEDDMPKEPNGNEGLESCAHDLISSIHAKDAHGVVAALQSAFELMEKEPHEEGEHTNDEEEQGEEE